MRIPQIRIQLEADEREQGRFLPGRSYSPRTQYRPGERRSIPTEFQKGRAADNKLPVGSVRIRTESNTWLKRAWVKVAEPNTWRKRAIVVWESLNGPLPRGSVVHHKDRDSLNDAPKNLVGLTRKQHAAEHQLEIAKAALKAARKARTAA